MVTQSMSAPNSTGIDRQRNVLPGPPTTIYPGPVTLGSTRHNHLHLELDRVAVAVYRHINPTTSNIIARALVSCAPFVTACRSSTMVSLGQHVQQRCRACNRSLSKSTKPRVQTKRGEDQHNPNQMRLFSNSTDGERIRDSEAEALRSCLSNLATCCSLPGSVGVKTAKGRHRRGSGGRMWRSSQWCST